MYIIPFCQEKFSGKRHRFPLNFSHFNLSFVRFLICNSQLPLLSSQHGLLLVLLCAILYLDFKRVVISLTNWRLLYPHSILSVKMLLCQRKDNLYEKNHLFLVVVGNIGNSAVHGSCVRSWKWFFKRKTIYFFLRLSNAICFIRGRNSSLIPWVFGIFRIITLLFG